MDKIYNISIVLSFLGLWITSTVPEEFELFFGFTLIFTFGILHGSNDILLIENIFNKKTKHPFLKILAIYLITVLVAIIIFYFIPLFALLVFVLFSAFHFGEQHWENKFLNSKQSIKKGFFLFYGLFILMLLFIFNSEEVIAVVESISDYKLSNKIILFTFIATSIILLLFLLHFYLRLKEFKRTIFKELFFLLIFTIIFKVSSLIWGFTIYFIFWHSIPSLFDQVTFVYGSFKKETILLYFKKAFPYWIVSLIALAISYGILKDDQLLYAILFSFIAAVTFPHSLVITKMFRYKKTQTN